MEGKIGSGRWWHLSSGWWLLIAAALVSVALWAAWCVFGWGVDWSSPAERGQFGDWFGSLTSLFTALAFIGMMAQIHLQREELKDNRKVMEDQQKEMALQAKAMGEQVEATRRLHAQGDARVVQEHALRVLDAHNEWLLACREACAAIDRFRSKQAEEMGGSASGNLLNIPGSDSDSSRDWGIRAQKAAIRATAAAERVMALDPSADLPQFDWDAVAVRSSESVEIVVDRAEVAFNTSATRLQAFLPLVRKA